MADEQFPRPISNRQELDAFLKQADQYPAQVDHNGMLAFALDATASRQYTWDRACQLQSEMFLQTGSIGQLQIQLCYYRGFGEFHVSRWMTDTTELLQQMNSVCCAGGKTQIARLLKHLQLEHGRNRIQAAIFIGDAMEEDSSELCQLAGQLGLLGLPLFLFQEGNELVTKRTFKKMAELSGGAYCHFDSNSAILLKDLLGAVAVFATGGKQALQRFAIGKSDPILKLTHQLS